MRGGKLSAILVAALHVCMHARVVAAGEAAAPTVAGEAQTAQVRRLVRVAERAFVGGDLRMARKHLEEAWALQQSYDVASMIGQVELELGNHVMGAQYLSFALKHFAPSEPEEALAATRRGFEEARKRVCTVHLEVSPSTARVRVDGVAVQAPFGPEVFVLPGAHKVAAERDGRNVEEEIVATAGQELRVSLVVPVEPHHRRDDAAALEPARRRSRPSVALAMVGGGVAVVGAGLGVGLAFEAAAAKDKAERISGELAPSDQACQAEPSDSDGERCQELRRAVKREDRARNWSTVSFAVGGAAAIATIVYLAWPRQRTSVGVSVRPVVGVREVGLAVEF